MFPRRALACLPTPGRGSLASVALLSLLRASVAVGVALTAGCSQDPPTTPAAVSAPTTADAPADAPADAAGTAPAPRPPDRPASASPTAVVESGDGRLVVVPGTGPVSGPGQATPYVVEVEGGLGIDAAAFAREVDRVLTDPRSWGAAGRRAVRRVDGGAVAFRVALASPRTTDRLCAPLETNGYFSCASGDRAVLNLARWQTGARAYDGDLPAYRQYLVNHEVGHTLGRGHEQCPGAGEQAPVMQQQSKGLAGCAPNSWPYP